jgi:hypothetical protein
MLATRDDALDGRARSFGDSGRIHTATTRAGIALVDQTLLVRGAGRSIAPPTTCTLN